jgi:hypothetical protein
MVIPKNTLFLLRPGGDNLWTQWNLILQPNWRDWLTSLLSYDPRGQFHQHFTRSFLYFLPLILPQKLLLKCWWNCYLSARFLRKIRDGLVRRKKKGFFFEMRIFTSQHLIEHEKIIMLNPITLNVAWHVKML